MNPLHRLLGELNDRSPAALRRALLSGLIVGVPVAFLRFTSDPFNLPKLALLAAGVAVVLGLRVIELLQERSSRGLDLLVVPALLMAVPFAVSWALSPYRGWAILGLQARFQGLVPYLLVIVLGILIADAFRGRTAELAFALMWAGGIVGAYTVLQTIGLDPFDWTLYDAPTEAISTTGNSNFTGGYLGIVLPVGLALVLTDPGRRRVGLRLLLLIAAGWIAARSQGGWAAGLAGVAMIAGYFFRDRFRLAPVLAWALATLIATVTVGVVLVAMVKPESRFTASGALVRARWSQAAFSMGAAHPIAGRGPNTFAIEGIRHRSQEDALAFNFDFPDDPHSVPMAMFANLGVPGLLGFVAIMVWAISLLIRARDPSLLQVAFGAAVVAYFVQSLVSIDELTLRSALWIALGGSVAATYAEEKVRAPAPKPRTKRSPASKHHALSKNAAMGGAVVVAVTVAAVAWALSLVVADTFARQGSLRLSAGDVEGGRARYETALSLRDSADYRGRLAFALKESAVEEEGRVDRDALAAASDAFSFTRDVPYVFSIVAHARLLEEAAGDSGPWSTEAVDLYERAMQLDPRNPIIRIELARALLRRDLPDVALELLLERKDVIGDRYADYWGVLALSAATVGELDLARESVEMAEALSPGQAEAIKAKEILEPGAGEQT